MSDFHDGADWRRCTTCGWPILDGGEWCVSCGCREGAEPEPPTGQPPVPRGPRPRARSSDPMTSHDAAESMADVAADAQRAQIRASLASHPAGLTNDEIDTLFGWRTGTASRRMIELVRMKLAMRSEETRATTAGRQAHVHLAATS